MAKWGSVDYRQLEQLNKRLEQLNAVDLDTVCRQLAAQIAQMLWAKCVKRTPVGVAPTFDEPKTITVQGADYIAQTTNKKGKTVFRKHKGKRYRMLSKTGAIYDKYWSGYKGGTLRRAWRVSIVEKQGSEYTVTVENPTEYASYVEFGHRQTPGRYVPALGKSLKASWVQGKFMMTISAQEVQAKMPKMTEQAIYEALKGAFDAK